MLANHDYIDPTKHGWERVKDGQIDIQWTTLKPAPDALLEFMACNCKKTKCASKKCRCYKANLNCKDLCGCNDDCDNYSEANDDSDQSESDDENEEDKELDEID